MPQTKRGARVEVRRVSQRVRKAVDEGADAAEEIHKKLVNLPLDVLERNGVLESTAHDLRRFQDTNVASGTLVAGGRMVLSARSLLSASTAGTNAP